MLFGEADIVEIGNVARQAVGAHGQHALVAFAAHFGFAVGFHLLRVGVAVAVVGLIARHFGARVDLAFAGAAVLAFLFFRRVLGLGLVLLAAVFGALLERFVALDQVEVAERELRGFGKSHLIVEQHRQRSEVAARLVGDPFAHQRQAGLGPLRRLLAGQCLAQHQFERARNRHILAALRAADRVAAHPHREARRQIAAHPVHVARARAPRSARAPSRRTPRRRAVRRARRGVQFLAVMLHAQGIAVGKTTRFGDLIGGQGTRGGGHLDRLADLRRRVGGKAHLDLGIARHRARHARQCGLEIVEGRLGGHFESALTSFDAGRKRQRSIFASIVMPGLVPWHPPFLVREGTGPRIKSGVTKGGSKLAALAKLA